MQRNPWTILKDIKQLVPFSAVFKFITFLLHIYIYRYIIYTYTTVHHKYPFQPYVCSIPKQLCLKRQRGMRLCRAGRRLARPARCVGSGLHLGGWTAGTGATWKFYCLPPWKSYRAPKGKGSSSNRQFFRGYVKLRGEKNHPCVKRNHLPSPIIFSGWRFVNLLGCIKKHIFTRLRIHSGKTKMADGWLEYPHFQ